MREKKSVYERPHRKRMKTVPFLKKYGRIIIGCTILSVVLILGLCAPLLTEYEQYRVDVYSKFIDPFTDPRYLLGTDTWGRDMLTQLLYGARVAVLIPFGVQAMTIVFGTILGLICGYYKTADFILSRIMEAFNCIPTLILCLLICEVVGKGVFQLMFSLAVDGTIGVARLVRGKVLSIREEEYIECEKVMGASDVRTLLLHVLPACANTLLVRFSSGLSSTLLTMVGLSFVSIGLPQQIPNWGLEVALGRSYIILKPYLTLYPAICICITTFAFCMIGDGMRAVIGSGRS